MLITTDNVNVSQKHFKAPKLGLYPYKSAYDTTNYQIDFIFLIYKALGFTPNICEYSQSILNYK